jgi:hypothetical protein
MGKQVFATIVRRDETEALCIVEPLHFARLHYLIPRKLKRVIDPVLKIQKVALHASLHACGRVWEKLFPVSGENSVWACESLFGLQCMPAAMVLSDPKTCSPVICLCDASQPF